MNRLSYKYGAEYFPVLESSFVGLISGVKGSGKTSLIEPILASAITGGLVSNWKMEYPPDIKDIKVKLIDTELPESLIKRSIDRVYNYCKKAEGSGTKINKKSFEQIYEHVNLVDHIKYEEKRYVLFEEIDQEPFTLMVIDNISGLCDPLDSEGADELFQTINARIKKTGGIVIAINHLNKDGASRGWAGRKFEEWGSATLKLEKYTNYGVTVVSSDKCRLGNLPTFDFSIKDDEVVPGPFMCFPAV